MQGMACFLHEVERSGGRGPSHEQSKGWEELQLCSLKQERGNSNASLLFSATEETFTPREDAERVAMFWELALEPRDPNLV